VEEKEWDGQVLLIGSTATTSGGNKQLSMDIDWLKEIMKEKKNEIVRKMK